jgi:hypothetical protein
VYTANDQNSQHKHKEQVFVFKAGCSFACKVYALKMDAFFSSKMKMGGKEKCRSNSVRLMC